MHNNNNHIYQYSGFLLIDLVISIGIFSGFCLLISGMNWQLIKQEREIRLYRQSIDIANNIIEEIHAKKVYNAQIMIKGPFSIKIEKMSTPPVPKKAIIKFQCIKINIHWKTDQDHQISIMTSVIT